MEPLLLINIAGLGHSCIGELTPNLSKLAGQGSGVVAVQPPVPALTSTSQTTLLTGAAPAEHGIVANGWYFRDLAQVLNWQRSANLVDGEPLWETMRTRDPEQKSANLFWRYAAHSSCDVNVMERPTYWADGRKGQDIYCEPGSVRDELVKVLGPFPLFRFWGPAAGIQSTQWIVDATIHLLRQNRYGLLLTYLPHLDYDHQRFGPDSEQGQQALRDLDVEAGRLIDEAQQKGMRIAVVSDYAFENVSKPVYLNRALREAGYINVQQAENGELLEHGASRAFAVCDQQIAHVYVNDPGRNDPGLIAEVKQLLEDLDGVGQVLDGEAMKQMGIAHPRSGELLAIAAEKCWFTYHYWLDESKAPDFAKCVAIHAKPGWDPVELFLAPGLGGKLHLAKRILQSKLGLRVPFDVIADDANLIGGSHGRIPTRDAQRAVLITSWDCQQNGTVAMDEIKNVLLGKDRA